MRLGGQYVANALPMTQFTGTGPQKRLSSEAPRLSPMHEDVAARDGDRARQVASLAAARTGR